MLNNRLRVCFLAVMLLVTQLLLVVHASSHHVLHVGDKAPCELCLAADNLGHGITADFSQCLVSGGFLAPENMVFTPRFFIFIPSSPLPRSPPLV